MKKIISGIGAFVFSVTTHVASAAPGFDPSQFQIEKIIQGGSDCPAGSVTAVLAPNAGAFSILYDKFLASAGGPGGVTVANATCNVKLKLRLPPGWALAIESADFRGFISLAPGMSATQNVKFKLGQIGIPLDIDFGTQVWTGPMEEDYVISTLPPTTASPSDGCAPNNRTMLELKTRAQVRGGSVDRTGQITVDSADGEMVQRYHLAWRNCTLGI